MRLSIEQLAELARAIADTAEEEIDCEEMLARAAAFIEAVAEGDVDLPASLRVVAQHLRVCPECREEVELLLQARFGEPPDTPG